MVWVLRRTRVRRSRRAVLIPLDAACSKGFPSRRHGEGHDCRLRVRLSSDTSRAARDGGAHVRAAAFFCTSALQVLDIGRLSRGEHSSIGRSGWGRGGANKIRVFTR